MLMATDRGCGQGVIDVRSRSREPVSVAFGDCCSTHMGQTSAKEKGEDEHN